MGRGCGEPLYSTIRRTGSVLAVVHDPCHLGPQIAPRHDAVDEAMFEQELTRLEAVGELEANRVPDGALACEADQGSGLGERDVALQGEAGGDTAHRGIG